MQRFLSSEGSKQSMYWYHHVTIELKVLNGSHMKEKWWPSHYQEKMAVNGSYWVSPFARTVVDHNIHSQFYSIVCFFKDSIQRHTS